MKPAWSGSSKASITLAALSLGVLLASVPSACARACQRLRACGYQHFSVTAPEHLQGNRIGEAHSASEFLRELSRTH